MKANASYRTFEVLYCVAVDVGLLGRGIKLHHDGSPWTGSNALIDQVVQQIHRGSLLDDRFGGCQDHAAARICRSVTKIALRRLQSQCSAGCGQQRSTRSEGQCPRNQAHRGASPPSRRSRVVDTTRASHPAAIVALLKFVRVQIHSHSHCFNQFKSIRVQILAADERIAGRSNPDKSLGNYCIYVVFQTYRYGTYCMSVSIYHGAPQVRRD